MNPKQIKFLALLLAFLAGAVFLKSRLRPADLAVEEYQSLNLSFDAAAVAQIEIIQPRGSQKANTVTLVQTGGHWVVADLWNTLADETKVAEFLGELNSASGEIRTQDPGLYPDFGLQDDSAYRVRLLDAEGKHPVELFIGTKKAGYEGLFIRKAGEPAVFFSTANLFGRMGIYGDPATSDLRPGAWSDTRLFRFQSGDVGRFEIYARDPAGNRVLLSSCAKKDQDKNGWQFMRKDLPFAIDSGKVSKYLESLQSMRFSAVMSPGAKELDWENYAAEILLLPENGKAVLEARILKQETAPGEAVYAVRISGEDAAYAIDDYTFDAIISGDALFFKDNPLEIDEKTTVKLVLHEGTKQRQLLPLEGELSAESRSLLDGVMNFEVKKIEITQENQTAPALDGKYLIEVQNQGDAAPWFIEIGEASGGEKNDHPALRRGHYYRLTVSEETVSAVFPGPEAPEAAVSAPLT